MINTYFELQIKENFRLYPTFEQEKAIKTLSNYLFSGKEGGICLLKGYAGTGKTSLVGALVKTMTQLKQPVVLLAPTGRAAKVFSLYASHPAYTIHRRIYREKTVNDLRGEFALNFNKYNRALFIVDEASMISNQGLAGGAFGSGRLLDDLLSFVFSGTDCKLLLLGDSAQLPPVGEEESPALSESLLAGSGHTIYSCELTQVVRQQESSGILYNATKIRQQIQGGILTIPKVKITGFEDVCILPGNELIEALSSSYSRVGIEDTMVICKSNKRAIIYNNGIRNQILGREDELAQGDRIMVAKNNYYWTEGIKEIDFIANGDIAIVRRVRRHRELYGFRFADVTLEFPDYDGLEVDATVLLDTLQSESPALKGEQQEELYNQIMAEYEELPVKEKYKKLKTDAYYNALQIKYAYAITCHKSQGGQWAHIYLDQGYLVEENITSSYFHWLYTAFTRATEKLYLVNWPEKFSE